MAQLPNEMLVSVFLNLSPPDLYECALVSRRLRAVAERVLYAQVVIADTLLLSPGSSGIPFPYRTVSFCETVLRRPDLAECAKRLSVRWHTHPSSTSSSPSSSSPPRGSSPGIGMESDNLRLVLSVLPGLNAALRTLPGLESLDLALGLSSLPAPSPGHSPPAVDFSVLADLSLPALRTFSLSGVGRGTLSPKLHPSSSTPSISPLIRFLERSPLIHTLRLADCHDALHPLAPHALPHLAAFRGSAPTAASLLPNRPVQLLSLVGDRFVTERDLRAIASTAGAGVRWLDLSGMSVTPLLLRDFSRYLRGVEWLKVRLALRHTLHHALSGITLLVGLTSVLGAFPELRQLDLSPTNLDGVGQGNAHDEWSLCAAWAHDCPTLAHVIFPSKTEWLRDATSMWVPVPATVPVQSRSVTASPVHY